MSGNPIEYSVVCIDNSDYMRNEDIRPNRFMAVKDAANILFHHILTTRPENHVAIVTLANGPQVIQSLTNNEINVMRKLYDIQMVGEIDLKTAIKISTLALRQISLKGLVTANKKQRIILFVGSPFKEDEKQLDSLVRKLNKLKISVDIISFGSENNTKTQILQSFVSKLKDSHFLSVPNDRIMNNVLAESSILSDSRQVSLVNENMDPELALAMKLSLQQKNSQLEDDTKRALNDSLLKTDSKMDESLKTDDDIQKSIDTSLEFIKKNNIPINETTQLKASTSSNGLSEEELLALTLQMSLLDSQIKSKESTKKKKSTNRSKNSNNKESKKGSKRNVKKQ